MKKCLIVFAKEPQKDRVKTRLRGSLSKAGCVNLYKAFLKDTINTARNIECKEKVLAYESNGKDPKHLRRIANNFRFYKQRGRDLGERMHNAFKFAKELKTSKAIIIGSDSPTLPPSYIKDAFRKLNRKDVVLGPSHDGGYYLVGLKVPCFGIFKGIRWSSNKVLDGTIKNCRRLKKNVAFLDVWYDVDEPSSLSYLIKEIKKQKDKNIGMWTGKFLNV